MLHSVLEEKESANLLDALDVLESRGGIDMKPGMKRGPFVFLWKKTAGVEPGFECIKTGAHDRDFWQLLRDTIQDEIEKEKNLPDNEKAVTVRMDTLTETGLPEDTLQSWVQEFLFREENKISLCSKRILERLHQKNYPRIMVKMDYDDGKYVTISESGSRNSSRIQKIHGLFGEKVTQVATSAYRFFRTKSPTEASVDAFMEYFITEKIARHILGQDKVQETRLISRENWVDNPAIRHMFALGVIMNPEFRDYSSLLEDPTHEVNMKGLGETFALQTVFGNYDAFGKAGDNAGYDQNGYFIIDLGKALSTNDNVLVKNTSHLLLCSEENYAKNFSLYEETSLASRVRGLLLLNRSLGNIPENEEKVVNSHGPEFTAQYYCVKPISQVFSVFGAELDRKAASDPERRNHWNAHQRKLKTVEARFNRNAEVLLQKGHQYLSMTRAEIEVYENLSKLSVKPIKVMHAKRYGRLTCHLTYKHGKKNIQWVMTRTHGYICFTTRVRTHGQRERIRQLTSDLETVLSVDNKNDTFTIRIPEENLPVLHRKLQDIIGDYIMPDSLQLESCQGETSLSPQESIASFFMRSPAARDREFAEEQKYTSPSANL